jgi:HD superfamily phosphohydrolase
VPKWGLTAAMRRTEPWGLEESWLRPGKVFTDPVHGDIYLTELEVRIVDSPALQRLRKVRQLGTTHLVYPGATHTRFAHSLGSLRLAQDLMDVVVDQRSARDALPDLFAQWEVDCGLRSPEGADYTYDEQGARDFDRMVAEATILARLGGLLHDLCHVPYGHSIEDELRILDPHDKNEHRFSRLWKTLPRNVREVMDAGGLTDNVKPLILSKAGDKALPKYPFVEDVVGNTICADLLDYLRRDHLYTGLPLALGRRYEAGFYVLPKGDPTFGEHMVLRIHRNGQERIDVVSEILKHLRYRYELSERALVHHAKLAADSMVGKALEMWHDALWVEEASRLISGYDDAAPALPAGTDIDAVRRQLDESRFAEREPAASSNLDAKISKTIDKAMTRRGDDGVLESLADLPDETRPDLDNGRRRAVATLARDLENRRLYKRRARQPETRIARDAFHRRYGSPEARRRMELAAAAFAGIDKAWRVVIWLPPPDMRLKLAEVLVDDGEGIRKFVDREAERGLGTDIYKAHEGLWAVSVYMHREVTPKQCRLALASLSAQLDQPLPAVDRHQRSDRDPQTHYDLPPEPHDWPDRIAVRQLRKERGDDVPPFDELAARRRKQAARLRPASLRGLVELYRDLL